MKCHSKIRCVSGVMRRALRNTQYAIRNTNTAFTLVEVMTALVILAIISSSVLVVINRCMASATDSELRMQAFEVARNNMETLLSKDPVEETVEYGSSNKYPEIKWQTTVEMFYEPMVMEQTQVWVRGICSAEYTDAAGEAQTIELTHWLTGLTKEQLIQMIEQGREHPSRSDESSEPNEPFEPNRPSEPNDISEPNRPASESKEGCDSLPFCESFKCHLDAHDLAGLTVEDVVRYLNECNWRQM